MASRREFLYALGLSAAALSGCLPATESPSILPPPLKPTSTLYPSPTLSPTDTQTPTPTETATPDLPQLDSSTSEIDQQLLENAYNSLVETGYHSSTLITVEDGLLTAHLNNQNFIFTDNMGLLNEIATPPDTKLIYTYDTWSPWTTDPSGRFVALLPTLIADTRGSGHLRNDENLSFEPQVSTPYIHLSVDDGYWPENSLQMLDLAAENNWKISFFLNTNYLRADKATQQLVVSRILSEGHELGYHTSNHAKYGWGTADNLHRDMQDFELLVSDYSGTDYHATAMRPPYGYYNNEWLKYSALTNRPTYLWTYYNVDPGDPKIVIPRTLSNRQSAVVLLHTRPECVTWLSDNRDLINGLISQGYDTKTVTQALVGR